MKTLKTSKKIVFAIGILAMIFLVPQLSEAQVKIGEDTAPAKGAVLDLNTTSSGYTGGLKLPNVSITSLTAIPTTFKESVTTTADKAALTGTLVYNTNTTTGVGVYYWDGIQWVKQSTLTTLPVEPWNQMGTTNPTTANTQDSYLNAKVGIGTTTAASINGGTNNAQLTVDGGDASIYGLTVGRGKGGIVTNNILGSGALAANTTGKENVAIGYQALKANTTGGGNNAIGMQALQNNTTGIANNALGLSALSSCNGSFNIGIGDLAGSNITTGSDNIAIGRGAQVPSATASNQLSINNWIYGINGNIGVGTVAPSEKLQVNGKIKIVDGNQAAGKVLTSDANGVGTWTTPASAWLVGGNINASIQNIGTKDNYDLPIITNNTEKMRLTKDGKIGIGTSSPGTGLHLLGISPMASISLESTSSYPTIRMGQSSVSSGTALGYIRFSRDVTTTGSAAITSYYQGNGTNEIGDLRFITRTSTRMTIDKDGNVGVGTVSPDQKLHVMGTGCFTEKLGIGTTSPSSAIAVVNDVVGEKYDNVDITTYSGSNLVTYDPGYHINAARGTANSPINLKTGDNMGHLGFGGYVNGGWIADAGVLKATYKGDTGTENAVELSLYNSKGYLNLDATGGNVRASGDVYAKGVQLTSDVRYKKDIITIENPLSILSLLRGTTYEFRINEFPEKKFSSGRQLGVIAQEVENVLPELVTTGDDGYKSVNYNGLIPVLIEGIKAQQSQIELQQKMIEQLETRLKDLETQK